MSVYFIADPHLGHRNIHRFRHHVESSEHNDSLIMEELLTTVNKRDIVYFLGDVAFTEESLLALQEVKGRKILIKGNHDDLSLSCYLQVFEDIQAMVKYKGIWLTHAPIHPAELRGKFNLHGHVHAETIMLEGGGIDSRYLNACPEANYPIYGRNLLSLDEVRSYFWGAA